MMVFNEIDIIRFFLFYATIKKGLYNSLNVPLSGLIFFVALELDPDCYQFKSWIRILENF